MDPAHWLLGHDQQHTGNDGHTHLVCCCCCERMLAGECQVRRGTATSGLLTCTRCICSAVSCWGVSTRAMEACTMVLCLGGPPGKALRSSLRSCRHMEEVDAGGITHMNWQRTGSGCSCTDAPHRCSKQHPHPHAVLCKLIGRAAPRRTTRQTASLSLLSPTPASPPEPSAPCGQHCTAAACRCQPGAAGAPRNEARRLPPPPTETPPTPALAGGGQAAQQEEREACHGAGN